MNTFKPSICSLCLILVTLLFAITPLVAIAQSEPSEQLRFFHDDHDGRTIASVEPMQSLTPDGPKLGFKLSARHPEIEPVHGWRHPHGMNRNTAFQLNMLSQTEGRLTAVTYDAFGRFVAEGRQLEILRGPHREHIRLANGQFEYNQIVEPSVVTGLELRGPPLAPGLYETDIWAYGERRMNLRLRVTKNHLRLLAAKSVAHGDADPARGSFPADQSYIAADDEDGKGAVNDASGNDAEPEPPPPRDPVEPDTWASLNLEQKWAAYDADLAINRSLEKEWGSFLVRQKDDLFMEQLALHHRSGFETLGLGWALHSMGSDRSIRTAVWFCNTSGGHGVSIAQTILDATNTTHKVLGWLEKYPEQVDHDTLTGVVSRLNEAKVEPTKQLAALPPHDPAVIYAPWFDPDAKSTQREFERALDAFAGRNRFQEPYFGRFLEIVRAPGDKPREKLGDEAILRRQSAILLCSHLWRDKVPFDTLTALIRDPNADPRLREAAVLGSRGVEYHKKAVIMYEVIADPSHPGWQPALLWAARYGNGFSLKLIEELEGLNVAERALIDTKIEAVRKRVNANANKYATAHNNFKQVLEADAVKSPLAPELKTWVLAEMKDLHQVAGADDEKSGFRKLVGALEKKSFPEGPDGDSARDLRQEIIDLGSK